VAGEACVCRASLCDAVPGLREALENPPGAAWHLHLRGQPLHATLSFPAEGLAVLRLDAQGGMCALPCREPSAAHPRARDITEMAGTLAHEINQPIGTAANLLRGAVLRLQHQANQDAAVDKHREGLCRVLQRATDQVVFASRVVARARAHVPAPRLAPVEIGRVLRDCVRLMDGHAECGGVEIDLRMPAVPLWTMADDVMLQQLFVNLMRNAFDAMRDSPIGARRLALRVRARRAQLEVTVSDTGPGLGIHAARGVSDPCASGKARGAGIGLNLCRSVVALHQGRLWFTRNAGPGLSFHAALPRLAPGGGAEAGN
jgi:C4-dicarboxylate-specific signal transduction histidine kinase